MGRGLSNQQRRILAAAVALNAHRNGGTPRAAELVVDIARGTPRADVAMPGGRAPWKPPPTKCRYALAREQVDVFDDWLLVSLCGFRPGRRESRWIQPVEKHCPTPTRDRKAGRLNPRTYVAPGYRRDIRWRWDPTTVSHSRRVSTDRSTSLLVRRELLVVAPGPCYFTGWGSPCGEDDKRLASDIRDEFKQRRDDVVRGYYLTTAGIDATGDRWQELDVDDLLEHWETARRIR